MSAYDNEATSWSSVLSNLPKRTDWPVHRREAAIEDVQFLLDNDVPLDQALERVGVRPPTWQRWRENGYL